MSLLDRLLPWRTDAAQDQTVELTEEQSEVIGKLFEGRQDSFENSITGLGGSADLTSQSLIQRKNRKTPEALTLLYRFNGYVRRHVDLIPDQATRKGWRVVSRADDKPDQEPMKELDKELAINDKVGDAMRWGRLYGAGLIIMVNDDEDLEEPLDHDAPGDILNLVVLDRREFTPLEYNDDFASKHFRDVEMWQIYPNVGGSSKFSGGKVHRSRVLEFRGAKLPPSEKLRNDGVDDSIIEAPFNQFRNKSVLDDQMARLSHDARVRVLKLKGIVKQGLSDAKDALIARAKLIAQTINLTGVMLLLEGEEFTSSVDSVQGWAQLDDKARQALSGTTATPQTILFGDTPGGLNTDGASGRNNFNDIVAADQNSKLRPNLETLYTVLMASIGDRSDWELEFHPLEEMTEAEEAKLRKTVAETDAIYVNQVGAVSPDDVARSRFGQRGWQMELAPVDADAVEEADEGRQPLPADEEPDDPTDEAVPNAAPESEDVAKTAMNGAQVTSMVDVVGQVASKLIPPESGKAILMQAFQMSQSEADAMINPVANFEPPTATAAPPVIEPEGDGKE